MAKNVTLSSAGKNTLTATPATVTGEEAGRNFYALAKRLVAVPKEEIDNLRNDNGDATTA